MHDRPLVHLDDGFRGRWAIEQAKESKITVVVITQKPTLLSVVDKIMLLTDGRVALFGHREQVLQQLNASRGNKPGIQSQQGGPT